MNTKLISPRFNGSKAITYQKELLLATSKEPVYSAECTDSAEINVRYQVPDDMSDNISKTIIGDIESVDSKDKTKEVA